MNITTTQFLLFLTTMFWSLVATAGSISVQVHPQTGSVDDPFVLSVRVEGNGKDAPEFPAVDGLKMLQRQVMQGTQIINWKSSSYIEYKFVFQAMQPGTFTIPSFNLTVDGRVESSQPLNVRVVGSGQPSPESTESSPSLLMAEREFSSRDVYVGQPFLSTLRLYFRVKLIDTPRLQKPDLSLFRIIPQGEPQVKQTSLDDVVYQVIEVKEIFIPLSAGEVNLSPHTWQVVYADPNRRRRRSPMEDFFGDDSFFHDPFSRGASQQKMLQTRSDTLTVRPLPSDGRPQDFYGAVGQFTVNSQLSTTTLTQGDTATLTITVLGKGVLDGLSALPLSLPPGLKAYSDKPEMTENVTPEGDVQVEKVFKFALVAKKPGEFAVGNIPLSWFDPMQKIYQQFQTPLHRLSVSGGASSSDETELDISAPADNTPAIAKQSVRVLQEDLVELHRGRDALDVHGVTTGLRWLRGLASSLPLGLFLVLWITHRLQRRRRDHAVVIRSSRAGKRLAKKLREVEATTQAQQARELLYRSYQEYLGDKLNRVGKAITSGDLEAAFSSTSLNAGVRSRIADILRELERLEYGGSDFSPEVMQRLCAEISATIKQVEASC